MHVSKLWHIRFAAQVIRQGGVIAYPTETVWGLGCDPTNPRAVQRILDIKQRPESKGLILISGQVDGLAPLLAPLRSELRERFLSPQKEPTTWLVPDPLNHVPHYVKGQFSAAAVRLVSFPVVAELTKAFGGPIVSTSANRAGQPPLANVFKLRQVLGAELDYILPAELGGYDKPSTIRDLETNKVIRA